MYRLEVSLKSQVAWNITVGPSVLYKVVFVFCGGKRGWPLYKYVTIIKDI